jgi:hypothetical protein
MDAAFTSDAMEKVGNTSPPGKVAGRSAEAQRQQAINTTKRIFLPNDWFMIAIS